MTKTVDVVVGKEYKVAALSEAMMGFTVGETVKVANKGTGTHEFIIVNKENGIIGFADAKHLAELTPDLLDESKEHVLTEKGPCLLGFNVGDVVKVELARDGARLSDIADYKVTKTVAFETGESEIIGYAPIESLKPVEDGEQDETEGTDLLSEIVEFLTELASLSDKVSEEIEDVAEDESEEEQTAALKVGDYVKGTRGTDYRITTDEMTKAVVTEDHLYPNIVIKVLEHATYKDSEGKTFHVNAKYFEKLVEVKPDFKVGDKVKVISGGEEFPLFGFEDGEIYTVSEAYTDHSTGTKIEIARVSGFKGYAEPEQLELVTEPEFEQITFLEAMAIIVDGGEVYTDTDKENVVDKYTELEDIDYCSDFDDLANYTDWYRLVD